MAKNKYDIDDPYFNEYVFQLMFTAPADVKNRLPTEFLKHTISVEKMKAFAENSSLGQKLRMLSYLGGSFVIKSMPPGYAEEEKLNIEIERALEGKRYASVQDMIRERVFAFTSREVMATNILMAMNCHSQAYQLNRDYAMIASRVSAAGKKINTKITDIEFLKNVMEDHKLVCKLLLQNLVHQNFVDSFSGFKAKELMVLLYLFINRQKYVPAKEVQEFLASHYSPQIVNTMLVKLYKSMHLEKQPKKTAYAITALGIQIIGNYINRLVNLTLSF